MTLGFQTVVTFLKGMILRMMNHLMRMMRLAQLEGRVSVHFKFWVPIFSFPFTTCMFSLTKFLNTVKSHFF